MPDQREKYVQLQEAINRHKGEPGALMPVLQEAQNIFGYVPLDVQEQIADAFLQKENIFHQILVVHICPTSCL